MRSPAEVVLFRYEALQRGDFAGVYGASHPDSALRRMFAAPADYLAYARAHLRGALAVELVEVLRAETRGGQARVLLRVVQRQQGLRSEILERVALVREDAGWLCGETARVERQAFPGALGDLTWEFFDLSPEAVHY